jgi:hypothetical protein
VRTTTLFVHLSLAALVVLSGCSTPTRVISTDLTRQSGVYVVGYVDREDIRAKLEDRFVTDLAVHDIRAVASRGDIPLVKKASPADMVRAANGHDVVAILIVNRVSQDGSDGVIQSDQRIRPDDPDLQAYFKTSREELDNYGADEPVFAEVNAFFVDGSKTRRFWTGTTWTFQGEEDQVIGTISETIAAEIAKVAGEMRDYGRPIQ